MRRSVRNGAAFVLAAWLPTLNACYEYVPVVSAAPPADQLVSMQITDQGRVALNDRFGQGVSDIVGRITAQAGNQLTVNVYSVTQLNGQTTQWSGETVHLDRSNIGQFRERQFSGSRTALVAIGAAVGVGLLIANRGLLGSFSGATSDPPPSGPTPAKVISPVVP